MTETITVTLPSWVMWLIVAAAVLSLARDALRLYIHYLKRKLEKQP